MPGVFLSYSRGDRALASQLVRGLRDLGVEVWWDEDMPGLDWQEELARQINELAAVLVVWTPLSINSKNVRDEARLGQHTEKLVNVVVGVSSPPFPFDRLNGLPLDGWTGRESHGGWTRVIRTIEERLVAAGAMKPGELTATLKRREQSIADKRRAVADAEGAYGEAKAAEAASAEALVGARAEFAAADAQLRSVLDMQAGPALLKAAQQQLDAALAARTDAEEARRSAAATLAPASRSLADAKVEFERMFAESDRKPEAKPAADPLSPPTAAKVQPPERSVPAHALARVTAPSLPWRPIALGAAAIAVVLIGTWLVFGHHGGAVTAASSAQAAASVGPPAAAASAAPALATQPVFRDCADGCPEMVVIPAGDFTMGSPDSEPGRMPDEGPQHAVRVSSIAVGKYPVTVSQFARFVAETGYDAGNQCYTSQRGQFALHDGRNWRNPDFTQADNHPVVCVNWTDAQAYASWLSRKTGKAYRLLSEAEYEYADRAGSTTAYWWGDDADQACGFANGLDLDAKAQFPSFTVANCHDGYLYTSPVGSFRPNRFGLYDTTGDVSSWTQDCYAASYASAPTDGSANASGDCSLRVLRGGSWDGDPRLLRSAGRDRGGAGDRYDYFGFRLARTL